MLLLVMIIMENAKEIIQRNITKELGILHAMVSILIHNDYLRLIFFRATFSINNS